MLKKNTEIKIEMDESGAWKAKSPDYPGWSASGTESFACADVAAKDLQCWAEKEELMG